MGMFHIMETFKDEKCRENRMNNQTSDENTRWGGHMVTPLKFMKEVSNGILLQTHNPPPKKRGPVRSDEFTLIANVQDSSPLHVHKINHAQIYYGLILLA